MSYDNWKATDPDSATLGSAPQRDHREIITSYSDLASFWTFGREAWSAVREGWEPPDSDGVGGGLAGIGSTKDEAIADLLEQETDAAESDDGQPDERQEWHDFDKDC